MACSIVATVCCYRASTKLTTRTSQAYGEPRVVKIFFIYLNENTNGHQLEVNAEFYVYLYRGLTGFGPQSLIIGIFVGPEDGLGLEIRRPIRASIASGVIIMFYVLAAVNLERRITAA